MLKFFKSSYLDNHLSESVHIGTIMIGTSEDGFNFMNPDPRVHARGGAKGQTLGHLERRFLLFCYEKNLCR